MTTRIYRDLPDELLIQPSYLTIGNFDGVHRGHQVLVESMLHAAHAAGCVAGVLTFDPHPLAVLRPEIPLAYLTTITERVELLEAHGLDFVVILPFSRETAATSAEDFMRALVERLHLAGLWVGPDFALGRGREGTPERLEALGRSLGYALRMIEPYQALGGPVHSSRIRAMLSREGAAAGAAAFLGRPYQLWGEVTRGAGRGRKLGYPTANLAVPSGRLVPAFGIYACWAWLDGRAYPAAVSIGVRPTFDNGSPSVEAFLLDFQGDLYGQEMGLSFVRRLRPEQKFADVQALLAQMAADVTVTRSILSHPKDAAEEETDADLASGLSQTSTFAPGNASAGEPSDTLTVPQSIRAPAESGWEELSHTADWAIRLHGANQRQLFARAARAMYALQDADLARSVTLARGVDVLADNPAELLVAWLNALLLFQDLYGEMYTRFDLHDLSATGLRATVYGYAGTPTHTAIKAVTYWNLNVQQASDGWQATVTFDV